MKTSIPLLVLLLGAPVFAVPLSVSVVDAKGAPVAGADVQLESFAKAPSSFVVRQSGADGRATFEVEAPATSVARDFAGRLAVYKAGFALGNGVLRFNTPSQVALVTAGAPISGTVGNADKKPVAGAQVSIFYWRKNGAFVSSNLSGGPLKAHGQTTSDAHGKWTLGDLPPDVVVTVSVVAPGFARGQAEVENGASVQTTLQAGAQIKGRLLGLDAKPLAGVRVFAQPASDSGQRGYGEDTTGADGTFDLDSLEPSTYNVMFQSDEDAPYVVAAHEGVNAVVGTPAQLEDSRAVPGVLIGGKVTERGTGKGVEGVQIGIYCAVNPASSAAVSSATTDKNGVWTKRTLPGASKIYVMGTTQEFVREQTQQNLPIGPGGKGDISFEISRASVITGRLVDEQGKGVKTSSLVLSQKDEEYAFSSDENGDFQAFGPKDGEVEIGRSRWNFDNSNKEDAQWDIVNAAKFPVASKEPLRIQLKRAQVSSLELGVFDEKDVAIEGARVVVNLSSGQGDQRMTQPRELVSDKTGRVHLAGIRSDETPSLGSAQKEGFDSTTLPAVEKQNGAYHADITLKRRSGAARGETFDARGALVAEVRVFGSGVETTSDEAGHFSLAPLPAGVTEIIAWKGDGFFLGSSDGTRLDLKPQTLEATDTTRAEAVLAALRGETKNTEYWRRDSLRLEVASDFNESAARARAAGQAGIPAVIARFGSDEGVPLERWIALLQSGQTPSERLLDAAFWVSKRATLPADDAMRGWLASLQDDVKSVEQSTDASQKWQNAAGVFGVAALAERLGERATSDALFERGQVFVLKNFPETGNDQNPSQDDVLGALGEYLAVSPRFLNKLVALVDSDSPAYASLLQNGAPNVARLDGLEAARPFLDKLRAAPPAKPDRNGNVASREGAVPQAVTKSIVAGGKSNPKLAIELARALPPNSRMGGDYGRDSALCEAAFFQPPAIAASLWRESLPRLEPSAAMRFIARIAQTDEPLARGFYETARADFDSRPDDPNAAMVGRAPQTAAFAFYEARFNPARARFRLEHGFQKARKNSNARYEVGDYARAMAVFDANRAAQWADQIGNTDNNFAGFEAKRSIARWLALDPASRQKARFGNRFGPDESDF